LSILYRPVDSLSLRGSVSTAFRVPSLQQLFGTLTTVANEADQVGGTAFRPSITNGNPQLQPEEATVFNVGFSWRPEGNFLEGFQIDADYYNYDYTDIITRESSNTLLGADNAAIEAFAIENGFTNPDGTANFSTGGPAAVAAGVGNRTQIVRNEQGVLLRLLPDFVNASSADVSGIDLTASYTFSTAIGNWRLGIAGAWVNEYEVDTGSTIINSVGVFTDTNPVARTLPEWKINGTVNWS